MKKIRKSIVVIIIIIFIFVYAIINYNKIFSKLGFNNFSFQCWIKITSQKQGEKYLTISDGNQEVALIAHLQDENGLDKGLVLSHDNGEIFGGDSFLPEYGTYSFIVINYRNNVFELYLNNELVGKRSFSDYFNREALFIDLINQKLDIQDYMINNRCLDEQDISNIYSQNKSLTLNNIDYDIAFKENAYGKVSLPLTRKEISYISSDTEIMHIDGKYLIFNENKTEEDKNVSLICNYEDIEKRIDFIVRGNNDFNLLNKVRNKIDNMFYDSISESDIFPSSIEGLNVVYKPINKEISFINGKFVDSLDREKTRIDVEICVDGNEKFTESVTLFDEYYGYLLVRFSGSATWPEYKEGEEKIRLSISKNLNEFINLKDPDIISSEGSNRYRDPFIFRKNDEYIILSTQAFYYPEIYLSKTSDFVTYITDLIDITDYSFDIGLYGNYSWSPECFFDKKNNVYVLIYSDPEDDNSSIYAVTTKDFISFSSPYVFFNAGYKIIDATIYEMDGNIYLFYKDERNLGKICYAITNELSKDSTWIIFDDCSFSLENTEGPALIHNFINNKYYLFTDSYGQIYSTELKINDGIIEGSLSLNYPFTQLDHIRHFSILPITRKEYDLLVTNCVK